MHYLYTLYFVGFFIQLTYSASTFFNLKKLKKHQNIDMFEMMPDLVPYLINKPFLWPYYFVTEKGPVERLSDNKPLSQFKLDRCEKLNKEKFKTKLLQINIEKARELFKTLNI